MSRDCVLAIGLRDEAARRRERPAPARTSLLFGALLAAAALGPISQAQTTPEVPGNLRAPAGEKVIWAVHASGAQIYVCQAGTDGKLQWTLKAPRAELRDDAGVTVGRHYAGPTWEHKDGSQVTGRPVARAESPDSKAIPWLLLTAVSHKGQGVLSGVTSIQRIHTAGGAAPAASCDASKSGVEAESPYRADYNFYAP